MNVLLNIIVLILHLKWFQYRLAKADHSNFLNIFLSYLLSVTVLGVLFMCVQMEYLDGIGYLIHAAGGILLFWIWSSIAFVLSARKLKKPSFLYQGLLQNSLLLIIPVMIWLLLQDITLKIGG